MSQLHNPYAAPQANIVLPTEGTAGVQFRDASKGQRFLNIILDSILCNVLATIAGAIFGGILGAMGKADAAGAVGMLVGFGAFFLYYILLEGLFGFTLGKLITGTRVVKVTGGPPGFGAAAVRTLCRLIPFEAFTFLGEPGNGLHDKLSKTRVVRK